MRIKHTGIVNRVQRQGRSGGKEWPTLLHVHFDDLPPMLVQAATDCEDVTGHLVTLTIDIIGEQDDGAANV